MKKVNIFNGFVTTVLIFALLIALHGCNKKEVDDGWMEVKQSNSEESGYLLHYNKRSIGTPTSGIFRVWIKQTYLEQSRLSYSLYQIEFNYKQKAYRFLDVNNYDNKNNVLPPDATSRSIVTSRWTPITSCMQCRLIFIQIDKREFGGLLDKIGG